MKSSLILLFVLFFLSCNQKAFEDKRPPSQRKFISYIQQLRDSINSFEENKTLRNALLEKNIPAVKSYIKDSLDLAFDNWQVRLIEKNENYPITGSTQIKFAIGFDPFDESPKAINQSIILKVKVTASNKALFDAMQSLKINDYAKINGQFIEKEGFIDIDSYSKYKFSKNVLDNPEFNAEVKSLEKL